MLIIFSKPNIMSHGLIIFNIVIKIVLLNLECYDHDNICNRIERKKSILNEYLLLCIRHIYCSIDFFFFKLFLLW